MDGPETMIALSAVARNSGPIALILLRGSLKITFSGGWSGPPVNVILGPSKPLDYQPLLHLLTWLKSASSKNMIGFHQLPTLSPSKKTLGKTNTDNNDIELFGFLSPSSWHFETDHILTYSVLSLLHFHNLNM